MTIPYGLPEKQTHSLGESTSVPNQTVQFVANPDGSNIGGGGAGTDLTELGGNPIAAGAGNSSTGTLRVVQAGASTGTSTNVASSATNVTLLAANSARRGATVFNDSTQTLYLKLGATASTTSFSAKLATDAYYEVPFNYSGIIDGIWASANGFARVTELT